MKRVVILLAIVVVLYLVTVGLGVSQGEGDRDVESLSQSWIGALGSLTAWFAPELALDGIKCNGNGQPVSQIFRLTEATPACALALPADRDEDYRHAELSVVATGSAPLPDVFIKARFESENRPETCRSSEPQPPFWLEVAYTPNGDEPEGDICWLPHDRKKALSITVLEDGGTLTLTCTGCDADARREVVLRMR
jgi:hypothetical protein